MKSTGIIRRIDDLGRVVIPREIRRTLQIREGDPLEILVSSDNAEGGIFLKKYSPLGSMAKFAEDIADSLRRTTGFTTMITDRDFIIAFSGADVRKADYMDKPLSIDVKVILDNGTFSSSVPASNSIKLIGTDEREFSTYAISPVRCDGDPIGSIIMVAFDHREEITASHFMALKMATNFIAKTLEE